MRHVLAVQLARMGDLAQSARLIQSLWAEPETQVHLCVDHSLAALAGVLYPFAEIHAVPAHATGAPAPGEVLARSLAGLAELARLPFAAVYTLNASPLSHALAGLFDPAIVRGHFQENGRPRSSPWLRLIARSMGRRSRAPLNLVDLWGLLHPDPVRPEAVNPIPKARGLGRVGIVMAGRRARRSLPPEVLGPVVEAVFRARGGPALVALGSKSERLLVRRLARHLSPQALGKLEDACGASALHELPDMLQGLDLVLTSDTGLMHLAAHAGTPVQAFFLSSAWCWETGPYGFGHKIWQAVEPCSPCLESAPCPRATACLAPFAQPAFLEHLSGRFSPEWPDGLLGLVSMPDGFGMDYRVVDGQDPHAAERRALRNLLAEWRAAPLGPVPPGPAEELFQETDWVLPPGATREG